MRSFHLKFLIVFLLLLGNISVKSQSNINKDSVDVIQKTQSFLKAFNSFDWQNFRNYFSDDATLFMPFWKYAKRISGRKEYEEIWLILFPQFTDTIKNPMSISPSDINIQLYGKTAIVTFHLGDGINSLGRRTFIWSKQEGQWKIVHLHASTLVQK